MLYFNKFNIISEEDKYIKPSYGFVKIFELLNSNKQSFLLFSKYSIFNKEFRSLFLILSSNFSELFEKLKLSIVYNILLNKSLSIFPFFISDI